LKRDIAAIRSQIEKKEAQRRAEETVAAREALEHLHKHEVGAVWKPAGEAFSAILNYWNKYAEVAEKADALAVANGLDGRILAVEPAPRDFRSFLVLLLDGCVDERNLYRLESEEFQTGELGIFGARNADGSDAGYAEYRSVPRTEVRERRTKLDRDDVLISVLPDRRGEVRQLTLRSGVETIQVRD
jgi:hypothetical protein